MKQLSININTMEDVKREIDKAQRKACTSIVEIGYILRKADDAQIFKEKGYSSVFEFAKQEYGWDQSQASRFMAINKEYSAGGYSCILEEKYEGYGQAKLAEMLQLPESIREEIGTDMKRDDIREIKKEYKAAEEERTLESFGNAFAPAHEGDGIFQKAVKNLFNISGYAKRIPQIWPYLLKRDAGEEINEQDVLLAIIASGYGYARAGSSMIFFRKDQLSVLQGKEKETHTYTEFLDAMLQLSKLVELDTPGHWYLMLYGKQLPEEKTEVSANQSQKREGKSATNNENTEGDSHLKKVEKEAKKTQKNEEKTTPRSGLSTGGIPEKGEKDQPEEKKTSESPTNNENTEGDTTLDGQTEIGEFAEEMPIKYEKPLNEIGAAVREDTVTEKKEPPESNENNENTEGDIDSGVVPDIVDGVCQYCAGQKDIETNDGGFRLHITSLGIGRIESAHGTTGYGIIEITYCPKCGKKLGDSDGE